MIVPESLLFKLPKHFSFEEGSLLEPLVIGVHTAKTASLSIADSVVVLGAGPIGLAMAAAARQAGVRELFITAKYAVQREAATAIGIKPENILGIEPEEVTREILQRTENGGVDCVCVGVGKRGKTTELGMSIIAKGGRIVIAAPSYDPIALDPQQLIPKEIKIMGSHAFGVWNRVHEWELALKLMQNGLYPADKIVTHKFSIDNINDAFKVKMKEGESIKVMIVF